MFDGIKGNRIESWASWMTVIPRNKRHLSSYLSIRQACFGSAAVVEKRTDGGWLPGSNLNCWEDIWKFLQPLTRWLSKCFFPNSVLLVIVLKVLSHACSDVLNLFFTFSTLGILVIFLLLSTLTEAFDVFVAKRSQATAMHCESILVHNLQLPCMLSCGLTKIIISGQHYIDCFVNLYSIYI